MRPGGRVTEADTKGDGGRDREAEAERQRQRDRGRDKERQRQRDREAERLSDRDGEAVAGTPRGGGDSTATGGMPTTSEKKEKARGR